MARPKRIDLPFSLYHVFSRTNSGDIAFHDQKDWNIFLEYVSRYAYLFDYRIHAWCLMSTHFHLLMESSRIPRLSEFMRRLLTAYTVYHNRRHKRHGHLFQGRFKSYIVEKSDYFLSLSRYIHLNPRETAKPQDPFRYQGSSLSYYIKGGEPDCLHTKEILSWFKGDRKRYECYIREGMKEGQKLEIYQQRFIGGESFSQRINKRIKENARKGSRADRAIRKADRSFQETQEKTAEAVIRRVAEYYDLNPEVIRKSYYAHGDTGKARTMAIRLLREWVSWTGKEIGQYMGIKRKSIYDYLNMIDRNVDLRKDYDQIIKVLKGRV